MLARQMGGKRAAIDAPLLGTGACSRRVSLVVIGFGGRDGLLDILERQSELVRIELLRTPAKLHTLQLIQEVLQAQILRQRLVTLGNRRIALGARCRKQRLQCRDIGWQFGARAHARHRSRFACLSDAQPAA